MVDLSEKYGEELQALDFSVLHEIWLVLKQIEEHTRKIK